MASIIRLVSGVLRTVTTAVPYDQTLTVPGGGYSSGTTLTLPASGTYRSSDLQLSLEGQLLTPGDDFSYVGSGNRTQIQILFDLTQGERLRFVVDTY